MLSNLTEFNTASLEIFFVVIKVLVIFAEAFYVLFAFILVRQIKLMNRSFHTQMAPLFRLMGLIHFWASIVLVVISILTLL